MSGYDSKKETIEHISKVQENLRKVTDNLHNRSTYHDDSKLKEPEKSIFDEYTPKLKTTTYGSSEYKKYLQEMKVALDHHYKKNSHHPEHYVSFECNGCFALYEIDQPYCGVCGYSQFTERPDISRMSLLDLVEMICDWKAATERHADGDIIKSLDINKKRFLISNQLNKILLNTIKELGF